MANDQNEQDNRLGVRIALGVALVFTLMALGGLLAAFSGIETLQFASHAYGWLAENMGATVAVPAVVLFLFLLNTLLLLFLAIRCAYRKFFSRSEVWRRYRLDTFFWAEWQWDYTWKGKVTDLWCECDKCAEAMKPKVVPDGDSGLGVRFVCNSCGKQSTTIRSAESEKEALERVEKKIMRKIRVGKYRGEIEGRQLDEGKKKCF